jgi:hypothetical protein
MRVNEFPAPPSPPPPDVPVIAEPVVDVVQDAAEEGFRSGCKYENVLISFSGLFMKL